MHKVHGFSTKTFIIPTKANQLTYYLGDYQTDNLGPGAKVVALSVRFDPGGPGGRTTSDNQLLITDVQARKGYLTLVKDGTSRENIYYQKSLFSQAREYAYTTKPYEIFIPPNKLNWNESYIEFEDTVGLADNQGIEFNIYYTTLCQQPLGPNIIFDNNFEYTALNIRTIQVDMQTGLRKMLLTNGRNPLTNEDILVGMRINDFQFVTLDGKQAVRSPNLLGVSFLNMKVGSRLLCELCPMKDLDPFEHLEYSYLPLEPTPAKDFDWTGCNIELSNSLFGIAGFAYLIDLFYKAA